MEELVVTSSGVTLHVHEGRAFLLNKNTPVAPNTTMYVMFYGGQCRQGLHYSWSCVLWFVLTYLTVVD